MTAPSWTAPAALTSPLIGINNRNLQTFDTDLATTRTLAQLVPEGRTIVAESGLSTPPTSPTWPATAPARS